MRRSMLVPSGVVLALLVCTACGGNDDRASEPTATVMPSFSPTATAISSSATPTATLITATSAMVQATTPTLPPVDEGEVMLRGTFEWLAAALASGDVAAVEQVLSAEASASVSSGELQELVECFASTGAITIEAADFEVDPPTQRPRTARVAVTLDEPATTTATWVFVDQGEPNNHDWRLSELPACPAPTT